jgi:hypothetical protein
LLHKSNRAGVALDGAGGHEVAPGAGYAFGVKPALERKALEAREQREREREQRVKDRPKSRAKDKGCAPDDPLCGIKFD